MRYSAPVLATILFAAACDTPPAPEPVRGTPEPSFDVTTNTTDYKYHLVGQGTLGDYPKPDLVINALRKFRGDVSGSIHWPCGITGCVFDDGGASRGDVIEVVPPDATPQNYWCVNVPLEGFNFLILVQDTGDGQATFDQLAFRGGPSLTCLTLTTGFIQFAPLTSGDFKGDMKSK